MESYVIDAENTDTDIYEIYHTVNRLQCFLSSSHLVILSSRHPIIMMSFQHAHELTNTQHQDFQVCFADKYMTRLLKLKLGRSTVRFKHRYISLQIIPLQISHRHTLRFTISLGVDPMQCRSRISILLKPPHTSPLLATWFVTTQCTVPIF